MCWRLQDLCADIACKWLSRTARTSIGQPRFNRLLNGFAHRCTPWLQRFVGLRLLTPPVTTGPHCLLKSKDKELCPSMLKSKMRIHYHLFRKASFLKAIILPRQFYTLCNASMFWKAI